MKPAPTMTEMLSELPWLVAAATMTGTSGSVAGRLPGGREVVRRGSAVDGVYLRDRAVGSGAEQADADVAVPRVELRGVRLGVDRVLLRHGAVVAGAEHTRADVLVARARLRCRRTAAAGRRRGRDVRLGHGSVRPGGVDTDDDVAVRGVALRGVRRRGCRAVAIRRRRCAGRRRVGLADIPDVGRRAGDHRRCLVVDPLCEDVASAVADASSLPPLFVAVAVAVESFDCETEGTSVGPPPCWPPAVLTSTVLELPAPDWLADAPLCAFWEPPFATPAELPSSLDGCWLFVAVAVAEASFCWETPCSPPCPAEPLAGVLGAGGTTTTIVVVFCAWLCAVSASLSAF